MILNTYHDNDSEAAMKLEGEVILNEVLALEEFYPSLHRGLCFPSSKTSKIPFAGSLDNDELPPRCFSVSSMDRDRLSTASRLIESNRIKVEMLTL